MPWACGRWNLNKKFRKYKYFIEIIDFSCNIAYNNCIDKNLVERCVYTGLVGRPGSTKRRVRHPPFLLLWG